MERLYDSKAGEVVVKCMKEMKRRRVTKIHNDGQAAAEISKRERERENRRMGTHE
jgi:hypothetical protein